MSNGCEIMQCNYWDKVKKICVYAGDVCIYGERRTGDDEYDTLKAKADAFDDAAGALRRHWAHCPNTASGCKLCEAHFKAKELQ